VSIPPTFSPPTFAIWVNSLWFLSLTISLSCAMLGILVQQWSRQYIKFTRSHRFGPHEHARIHAFFSQGVNRLGFDSIAQVLPTLIHISLFLFFSGL
ncbi:hypothetical protein BGW80DRAFT_1127934, partial [Lactifluus volemus]